ncbi:MAG: sigma-70 family RNA polymerase sigma factor [Bacteroidales bacterium]|jgi:RNA polymerase sigma factor (sigma-70 family)|nr:sigma-70 family RNA polymerase sigma factor [Bacteroidales bacterium]
MKFTNYYSQLTDSTLQHLIISGDEKVAEYLICEKCISMIEYHARKFFSEDQLELNEALSEVYLLLRENNWTRLYQYQGINNASLQTYLSIVVHRYFRNMRKKIDEEQQKLHEWLVDEVKQLTGTDESVTRLKVRNTLERMSNQRYRIILKKVFFEEKKSKEIAEELGITIENYYNKLSLAKKQFAEYYNKSY